MPLVPVAARRGVDKEVVGRPAHRRNACTAGGLTVTRCAVQIGTVASFVRLSKEWCMSGRVIRMVAWPLAVAGLVSVSLLVSGQSPQRPQTDKDGEWTYYGGDARNWR